MRIRTALIGWMVLATLCGLHPAWAQMPYGDPARGFKLSEECGACHGAGGVAADGTLANLAGQNIAYLEKQLMDMRSEANDRAGVTLMQDLDKQQRDKRFGFTRPMRTNEIMDPLVADLSDQDIADLAAHFYRLPCGSRRPDPLVEVPRQAVRCGACHGSGGVSGNPLIPNIAGQPEAYLAKRLRQFREIGLKLTKKERRRDIMSSQARLLKDADIALLSAYFAGLPCR
jgi:cytochrome c553